MVFTWFWFALESLVNLPKTMILKPHSGLGRFCLRLACFGEFIGPVAAPKSQTKTNPIAIFY